MVFIALMYFGMSSVGFALKMMCIWSVSHSWLRMSVSKILLICLFFHLEEINDFLVGEYLFTVFHYHHKMVL